MMKVLHKISRVLLALTLVFSLVSCGAKTQSDSSQSLAESLSTASEAPSQEDSQAPDQTLFPDFQGQDFEGQKVDQTLFGQNTITLVNFWFNGCPACVAEMPTLEKINAKQKDKGGEIIGVNVEVSADAAALDEAKSILSKQGATYRNISIAGGEEAIRFMSQIYAYPTTFFVDKSGRIVGDPIVGSLDDKSIDAVLDLVDDFIS
jgi:thiol-disulfide isomerase/thioredoxin